MKTSTRKADSAPFPDERHCSIAVLINALFIPEIGKNVNRDRGKSACCLESPFLLAILTNQIRSLIKLRASFETSGNLYVKGVFATNAMKAAARRIPLKRLAAALDVCADIDRLSKGLSVRERDGDPWIELKSVCLFLARTR